MFSDSILVNDVNDIEIDVAADSEAGFLTRVVIGTEQTVLDAHEIDSLIAALNDARIDLFNQSINNR